MSRGQAAKDLGIYVKGLGNALIFAREDGILHLIYSTIVIGKWSGSSLNMTSSQDGGHTWEKSRSLFLSPCFNLSELVKNAPIPLVGRGWVIPVYQEFLGKFPELLWLSPDEDCSWIVTKSRIAGGCSLFQPTLTAFTGNKVMAFFRDYYTSQKVWSSQSDDACRTWSLPKPTSLPNHDSGVASLRLLNGSLLLAFNDSSNSRDTLRLAISNDEGENWTTIATIIKEPNGDFCYPYFFRSRDGFIHLLYTWQRRHIHHVLFNEAWVRQQHTLDTPSTISITTSTP
jgi:predicted neuraminidase